MKRKNENKKTLELWDKIYENRFMLWIVLLPVISIIYHKNSLNAFIDIRFLTCTIFLSAYTLILYWSKRGKKIYLQSKPIQLFFGAGILFFIWCIISSLFSISYYECLFPLAKIFISGLTIFYVMESLTDKKAVVKCFKAFTILVLFHAIVGILQATNVAFTELPGGGAPNGFMGNRNVLGSFLAASLCFPSFLALQSRGTWKWFSTLTFFIVTLSILLTQTRTAWLSSSAAILLIPTGWLVIHGIKNYKGIIKPIIIGVLGLLLVIALTTINSRIKNTLGNKLESMAISDLKTAGDTATNFRFQIWEKSLLMTKDHPLFGVGLGNWKVAIPIYITDGDGFSVIKNGIKVVVKPHNIYLKVLSEIGIFGFLCFLSLLGIILFLVFKFLFSKQDLEEKMLMLFLSIGFVSFLIDMLPNFSMSRIEHTVLFSFIIGAILSIAKNNNLSNQKIFLNNKILFGSILLMLIYSFTIAISKFNFGKQIRSIKSANKSKNYPAIIEYANFGKSKFTKLDDSAQPIEMFTAMAFREQKKFVRAQQEIENAMAFHPNSAAIFNTYGTIFLVQSKFSESLPYFERAVALTPNDRAILKNLCKSYYFLEEYQKVIDLLANVDPQNDADFMTMYRESLTKVMGGN